MTTTPTTTMTTRMRSRIGAVIFAAATGFACAPKEVPSNPSWYEHVQPLFAGNCSSCHGAPSSIVTTSDGTMYAKRPAGAGNRYDIYDPMDFAEVLEGTEDKVGAIGPGNMRLSRTWGKYIDRAKWNAEQAMNMEKATDQGFLNQRMPPPPALELPEYERETFLRWIGDPVKNPDKVPLKGTRPGNAKPRAVVERKWVKGGVLNVTFTVTDADGDTVMGRVEAGGEKRPFYHSGRHTVSYPGLDTSATLRIFASDGLDKIEANLR